ncbi:MAG: acetyl-CoA sensor PanZ family protein [Moraxellaceae bacterium]|nr:acetyl-CoA sensor PanZ family protein [Moraxellaceae bacterium]
MPVAVSLATSPFAPGLQQDLARVYADSPEFSSPEEAATVLEGAVAAGETLYTGLFNGRHIAAVLVRGEGLVRRMRYLCVHDATRGRGVAERLVAEVRRLEAAQGTEWLEADFDLTQEGVPEMLLAMGFIPHGQGNYRCLLTA